jgi:hypothetical protein
MVNILFSKKQYLPGGFGFGVPVGFGLLVGFGVQTGPGV